MVPRLKVNDPFTYAFNNPAAQKSQQLNIVWNEFLLYHPRSKENLQRNCNTKFGTRGK
jgi:hypothetical protein